MPGPIQNSTNINTNPCTFEDEASNWQVQEVLNQYFNETIAGGGGDHKVAVNGSDVAPNYLHSKITNATATAFDSDFHVYVSAATVADITEQLYWDAQAVLGHGNNKILSTDSSGHIQWADASTASDSFQVKAYDSTDTPHYLCQAFTWNHVSGARAYVSGADLQIYVEPSADDTADQTATAYVDISQITGYSGSGFRVLGTSNGASQYFAGSDLADEITGSLSAYRMIFGYVNGAVTATSSLPQTFSINGVEPLANGLDPSSGNPAINISVDSLMKESLPDDTAVVAAYNGAGWDLLSTERYRSFRGTWSSGTSTLKVKGLTILESGLDPRADPTDTLEEVDVVNVAGDTYTTGDTVLADWNAADEQWEARPKIPAPNITVKFPTAISIALGGGNLTVTLDYNEYQIYGVYVGNGTLTDSVTTTECP